ncbi:MAG TPA: hypothetical protein VEE83_01875 [Thermoplasmata archaeon]|nr:hypothetical protein [Thermoplasmata archaeon]
MSDEPVYSRYPSGIGMTEDSKLVAFLLALQTSPRVRKRFEQNGKKEMERFGLAPTTIRAVLERDALALWEILLTKPGGHIAVATGVRRRRRKPKEPDPDHIAAAVAQPSRRRRRKPKVPEPHQVAAVATKPTRRRRPKPLEPEQIAEVVIVPKVRRRRRAKRA